MVSSLCIPQGVWLLSGELVGAVLVLVICKLEVGYDKMMMGIFILLQIQSSGLKAKLPLFNIYFQTVTASSQGSSTKCSHGPHKAHVDFSVGKENRSSIHSIIIYSMFIAVYSKYFCLLQAPC